MNSISQLPQQGGLSVYNHLELEKIPVKWERHIFINENAVYFTCLRFFLVVFICETIWYTNEQLFLYLFIKCSGTCLTFYLLPKLFFILWPLPNNTLKQSEAVVLYCVPITVLPQKSYQQKKLKRKQERTCSVPGWLAWLATVFLVVDLAGPLAGSLCGLSLLRCDPVTGKTGINVFDLCRLFLTEQC